MPRTGVTLQGTTALAQRSLDHRAGAGAASLVRGRIAKPSSNQTKVANADARLRERLLVMVDTLSTHGESQEALAYLAEEVLAFLAADLVDCWEVDVEQASIRLAARNGPQGIGPPVGTLISLHDPDAAVARAARTHCAEVIHTVQSKGDGVISATLNAVTGLQSAMVVPVSDGSQTPVVLVAGDLRDVYRFDQNDLEQARLLANTVVGALLRAKMFRATQKHLRDLEALSEVSAALASSLELPVVLKVITSRAQTPLQADAVSVLLSDPQTEGLVFAAGDGFRTGLTASTRLSLGQGISGRAGRGREPVFVTNLAKDERFTRPDIARVEGFVSCAMWPLVVNGHVSGVLEVFHRRPFQHNAAWCNLAGLLAGQAAAALANAVLMRDIRASHDRLAHAYDATAAGFARALDLRDRDTEGHSERVANLTVRLARRFGLEEDELVHVRRGALLHDIGKLGVPDAILHKAGPLDPEEWALMEKHTALGYQMLSPIEYLRPALDIPRFHHERWDGTGYPDGLRGEEIPLTARLFAVVDVWDALRSDRPYRCAFSTHDALSYLITSGGSHFDPKVVEAFVDMLGKPIGLTSTAVEPNRRSKTGDVLECL